MKIRKHHYDNKTQTDNFTSVEKKVHVEQAYLFKHKNSPWPDFGVNGGGRWKDLGEVQRSSSRPDRIVKA